MAQHPKPAVQRDPLDWQLPCARPCPPLSRLARLRFFVRSKLLQALMLDKVYLA
jgi:hypothetical protein